MRSRARRSVVDRFLRKEEALGSNPSESIRILLGFYFFQSGSFVVLASVLGRFAFPKPRFCEEISTPLALRPEAVCA